MRLFATELDARKQPKLLDGESEHGILQQVRKLRSPESSECSTTRIKYRADKCTIHRAGRFVFQWGRWGRRQLE